ncbi:gliding motility-associated C-terminal domain-containing protein, partial [Flavobacterium sp. ALJ2]|uniref:gliding motility-associated C-terminal domain-containing protein n=1 Tax=Flavobacterium sp. ALJ2 TaxID=2786960 RepID=UPI00189E3AFE
NFVIIPAGQNSAEFEVRAGNKRKNNERVEITGSVNNLIFDTATYSFKLESGAVIVKNDLLEIANVVSANGDGINDYFTIRNIEKYKDNTVTIVDRRGIEVFSARGYDNQSTYFDGQYRGKDLDDGTYFYFITISHKGIEHQYKGFLVLKR